MSHRSRLCAVCVDVPRDHYDESIRFYTELIGRIATPADDDPDYVSYGESAPGVELMVQAVGDPTPRAHLDIETDDIEAEVARLVGLGATEVARIRTWVVMRDPVGNPFCVVRVQMPDTFDAHATTWQS
jgi:hypothetical protein